MKYDIDAIKKNVKILMENNQPKKMTQEELGEIIGAKQTNISKYLNPNDPARFSLEQLICIAEYFNVTLDWLLNSTTEIKSNLTVKDICNAVPALVESSDILFYLVKYKERCFYHVTNMLDGTEEICDDTRENQYWALFFPNWVKPKTEEEYDYFNAVGNRKDKSIAANKFLHKFQKIYKLYQDNIIDEDDYQHLLKKHLDELNN